MRIIFVLGIISVLVLGCLATFSANSPVTQLSAKDFEKTNKGIWLVQFYAPWCGHCQKLAPEYEKAAKALKGIAKIAAINADSEKVNVAIQGFPTIKLFVDGKMSDFNGDRSAKGIIDFMLGQHRKIAYDRIGAKGSNSGSSSGSSSGSGDEKDVIILTDSSFDENVMNDKGPWFIQFYAPWCGHCQRLIPQWATLATTLKGDVKVAKIDATENKQLGARFGVQGYPTIKFFPAGPKDDSSAINYEGPRTGDGMADWAREQSVGTGHFEHIELTSQTVYQEYCKGKNLCIISFLPHKLDSTPEQRQKYLNIIKDVGLQFKTKPFKFLWTQGGDHLEVQQKLGIAGIGYPTVISIFETKKVYGTLKRAFSDQHLTVYLNQILANKAKFSKLLDLPTLNEVQSTSSFAEAAQEEGCSEDLCTGPAGDTQPEQL